MPLKSHRFQDLAGVASLVAALICSNTASAQLHAVPVTDPPLLYELDGFSVLPPAAKGWFEMQRDKQQALFGKKIESPTHSFGAAATSDVINDKFETREKFQE